MSKLTHYKIFVAIVETGSINQAALHLNYSAPAVSKQLVKLESNLRVQLFHRSHKKLEITDAGKRFYPRCKAILSSISQAEDELFVEDNDISGTLSITLSKALARSSIFSVLSAFGNQYPRVQFDIRFGDNVEDLHDENIDFAFRLGQLHNNSHLIAMPLIGTQLMACVTPHYLEKYGMPQDLSNLGLAKLILMSPLNSSEALRDFFYREKFRPSTQTTHICNDIEGVYQAVCASLGIGLLLDISIEKEIKSGIFTTVFNDRDLPRKRLYLIHKKSQWKTQKNIAFKAHIQSHLPCTVE